MQLNRSLGFWDVFAIALGQVIGSGIMVLVGIGIGFTGYGIVLAFMLSALLSIIKQIPASMAFLDIPEAERRKMDISDGMIRVSVGIEDINDLIDDFDRALALV